MLGPPTEAGQLHPSCSRQFSFPLALTFSCAQAERIWWFHCLGGALDPKQIHHRGASVCCRRAPIDM